MADHLGIPLEEYFDLLDDAKLVKVISTEDLPPISSSGTVAAGSEEIYHGEIRSLSWRTRSSK